MFSANEYFELKLFRGCVLNYILMSKGNYQYSFRKPYRNKALCLGLSLPSSRSVTFSVQSSSSRSLYRWLFLWGWHVPCFTPFWHKRRGGNFPHKVFRILLPKGKINRDLVDMLMSWRHSGFSVFCGSRIQPGEEETMENLARYIIRASFSQERMAIIPEVSKVVYKSKGGNEEEVFDALEWLATMYSHVPNKGEQMVRYYGFYSNVSRGKRKKQDQDGLKPSLLEPEGSSKEYMRNWACLIRKILEVDPQYPEVYTG
jgi:hypothetical protein